MTALNGLIRHTEEGKLMSEKVFMETKTAWEDKVLATNAENVEP